MSANPSAASVGRRSGEMSRAGPACPSLDWRWPRPSGSHWDLTRAARQYGWRRRQVGRRSMAQVTGRGGAALERGGTGAGRCGRAARAAPEDSRARGGRGGGGGLASAVAVYQGVVHVEELGRLRAARQAEHPGQGTAAVVDRAAGQVVVELAGDDRPAARPPRPRRRARSAPLFPASSLRKSGSPRVARSARVRSDSARSRSAWSACLARRTASASSRRCRRVEQAGRGELGGAEDRLTRARSSAVRAASTRLCSRSRRLARQET